MSENNIENLENESVKDEFSYNNNEDIRPTYVPIAIRKRILTDMIIDLPESVKMRIRALKRIQLATTHLEAQFYNEVHELENKYHQFYLPFFEKRGEIITGVYEPTEEECQWSIEEPGEPPSKTTKNTEAAGEKIAPQNNIINQPGVPDFWLTIFKNVSLLSAYVQEHDEPVLRSLYDIKIVYQMEPMSFKLEFCFLPNDYFTNAVLTKEYSLKCQPDADDPFSFEGPEIYKCSGCIIDWNKGKNVTMRVIKKKQKHKLRGSFRTVTKEVPNDSFFNFFSPPEVPEDVSEIDEETQLVLSTDYEIGHYLRERIVPRAVLYYTGEGLEDEEDDELDVEEDDEDNEEEEMADSINTESTKTGDDKLTSALTNVHCKI